MLALSIEGELELRYSGRIVVLHSGVYVYVGSAMGAGGLRARVKRHLSSSKKIHWHIDLVTSSDLARPLMVAYLCTENREAESRLAEACLGLLEPGPRGFGCSDRRRDLTHLFHAGSSLISSIEECFRKALNTHPDILWINEANL